MRAVLAALALTLAALLPVGQASAERRVALVVGIDAYANLGPDQQLRKAVNDARAVGDALRKVGFEVIVGENVGRTALVDRLDELTRQLSPGDVAAFFFAGHGVTIGGANYVLPADVPNIDGGQESRLARMAVGEADIVSDLQSRGVRVALVILDACRNNPFRRPGVRAVGGERGLARSEPVRGIFSLYSAGIGQTALDRLGDNDTDPNSVFTRVLVPALARPVHLGDLAIEVREQVAQLAAKIGHDQRPAYYDEMLGGRFYLARGTPAAATATAAPPQAAPPTATARPAPAATPPAANLVITGHEEAITALMFSTNGSRLASVSEDASVRLWNTTTGKLVVRLENYLGGNGLALGTNADSSRVLLGSSTGILSIWEPDNRALAAGGLLIGGPMTDGPITAVAFAPDGRSVAFAGRGSIKIYRTTSPRLQGDPVAQFKAHAGAITSMAFSDERRLFSAGADKTIRLWDQGKSVRTFQPGGATPTVITVSPDGRRIAAGTLNGTVVIWHVESGQQLQALQGHKGAVRAVAFTADSSMVASGGSDKTVRLWNIESGQTLATFDGHKDEVTSVAASPAGGFLASGSKDRTVRVWALDPAMAVAAPKR